MSFTYIVQFFSLIASFGVIAMTYRVYQLSRKHNQIDNYLKEIVTLYYKIEEDSKIAKSLSGGIKNLPGKESLSDCYVRIEINATLMRYYIRKYPGNYDGKEKFEDIVDSISHSPEELGDYDLLSDEFKKFCKNIEIIDEYESC